MIHVLYIDGKMHGFHLGTNYNEAKAIVLEKVPYHEGAVFHLYCGGTRFNGGKLVLCHFGGKTVEL